MRSVQPPPSPPKGYYLAVSHLLGQGGQVHDGAGQVHVLPLAQDAVVHHLADDRPVPRIRSIVVGLISTAACVLAGVYVPARFDAEGKGLFWTAAWSEQHQQAHKKHLHQYQQQHHPRTQWQHQPAGTNTFARDMNRRKRTKMPQKNEQKTKCHKEKTKQKNATKKKDDILVSSTTDSRIYIFFHRTTPRYDDDIAYIHSAALALGFVGTHVSLHSLTVSTRDPSATRILLPACTLVGNDLYEHAI